MNECPYEVGTCGNCNGIESIAPSRRACHRGIFEVFSFQSSRKTCFTYFYKDVKYPGSVLISHLTLENSVCLGYDNISGDGLPFSDHYLRVILGSGDETRSRINPIAKVPCSCRNLEGVGTGCLIKQCLLPYPIFRSRKHAYWNSRYHVSLSIFHEPHND